MKVKDVKPVYPPIAQSARVQGVVIVEAIIDADGKVADARVLRSIPLLDQAALDAVQQWEFTPTLLNGMPQRGGDDRDGELQAAVGDQASRGAALQLRERALRASHATWSEPPKRRARSR